jgi:uncharacterized membrane protein YkoI
MRHRNSFLFGAGAVAVAIGAAGLIAQTSPQPPGGIVAQPSQTSLAQAIRVAEEQTGGRARKAELESDRGVEAYEIKTVAKDRSAKIIVDLASGKALRTEGPGIFDRIGNVFDKDDQREDAAALTRLEALPMTLAAAVDAAEQETGGRAVEAAIKNRRGATLFEVKVVKELVPQKVVVDPASGKVGPIAKKAKNGDDD